MYVAVKGGEQAIDAAHRLLGEVRRGDRAVPELSLAQVQQQLGLAVDRVMGEASLYDRELAALAIKQACGDLIEAIFLLRAYRTTLPMRPSPIPKFDNPKLDRSPALLLFGAGREKRIYAVPPHTPVKSLDFEDHPFEVETWRQPCALCAATGVFLDEIIVDDKGGRLFVCSDTDHCAERRSPR